MPTNVICGLPLTSISIHWHASWIPLTDLQLDGRLMHRALSTILVSTAHLFCTEMRQALHCSPPSRESQTLSSDKVCRSNNPQDSLPWDFMFPFLSSLAILKFHLWKSHLFRFIAPLAFYLPSWFHFSLCLFFCLFVLILGIVVWSGYKKRILIWKELT